MPSTSRTPVSIRSLLPTVMVPLRVTIVCLLPVFLLGGLAVQIRSTLELSVSQVGAGVATFFLLSAIGAVLAGSLVERSGARRGLRTASALSIIALVGLGASPSYFSLLAFLGVAGLANAIAQVSSNLFLARRVPINRQGFAFGLKQAAVPAGTLIGGLAVPAIALTIGWRWAFHIAAAAAAAQIPLIPNGTSALADAPEDVGEQSRMKMLSLVVLAGAASLGAMAANALGAFFVDSTVSLGVSEGNAGFLLAAGSAAGLVVRVLTGWAADKRPTGRLLAVCGLLIIGAVGYLMLASEATILRFPAALLCFGAGWGWPGLFNFAVVNQNRARPAFATGITHAGAFTGGVFGPLLFGFTADKTSYAMAWSIASVWALLAVAGILLVRRMLINSFSEQARVAT